MPGRKELRSRMRRRRYELDETRRRQAAQTLAARVAELSIFLSATTIGAYLAVDGELDPALLIDIAMTQGRAIFLPVIDAQADGTLRFVHWDTQTPMATNRFGIPEPAEARAVAAPHELDLVLTPLVAFDTQGNRLGMGGGYYDRTFAFLRHTVFPNRPILLGLAYEFQRLPNIVSRAWDIPLWGIATESALYIRKKTTLSS